ncbi:MICAL-like protein 1 isoform X3 [Daphnia pulex]|uniref:MICAL-like protein 1 isoform X3 n=1 Tax=Daphnia pulex TaxID=6669 RepID=UPI001EE04337|nr:MICAL-like protein 1 isoform X3 [Daphnia pulex]
MAESSLSRPRRGLQSRSLRNRVAENVRGFLFFMTLWSAESTAAILHQRKTRRTYKIKRGHVRYGNKWIPLHKFRRIQDASLDMRGQPYKAEIFARQLQDDGGPSRQQARRNSDLCVSCKNAVFLAERLMVNGRLHHRVCFRCARCQSQLSLANYYETEQEQYCCETCPDEVAAVSNPTQPIASDQVSSDPASAIETTPDETSSSVRNVVESVAREEELERVSTPQQRSFLDSMVCAIDAPVVEVTRDSQPVLVEHDKNEAINEEDDSKLLVALPGDVSVQIADAVTETRDVTVGDPVEESQVVDQVPQEGLADGELQVAQGTELSIISSKELEARHEIVKSENAPETEELASKTDEKTSPDLAVSVHLANEEDDEAADNGDHVKLSSTEPAQDEESVNTPDQEKEISSPFASPVEIQVTTAEEEEVEIVVVPKPRRRKSKRSSTPQSKILNRSIDEYPDELNPFDDEPPIADSQSKPVDQSSSFSSGSNQDTPKKVLSAPKISLNPFGSDDEDDEEESSRSDQGKSGEKVRPGRPPPPVLKSPTQSLNVNPSPSPKKRPAPAPPPPKPQRTPSLITGSETGSISRRKSAPPPPSVDTSKSPVPAPRTVTGVATTPSPKPRLISAVSPTLPPFPSPSEKAHKDLSNLHLQCGVNKDSHGQWKRKKGPAPPRPSPQKRQLRKLPLKGIQQELDDIEIKQVELERQGVNLEQNIRDLTEPEDGSEPTSEGIHIEEMILQLFDLVNEKNELLRRQTELMYLRRQQRLEEEHAELEFQIRCLLEKPNGEKTDEDRLKEEELINRLVQVVHRRAEIVDCLEMDRRRQVEEDESIQQHLDVFNSRGAMSTAAESQTIQASPSKIKSKSLKLIQSPIKLMKKDKLLRKSKKNKVDADKEVDESETASTSSPPQSAAADASISPPSKPASKEKEKHKTKSWFAK